MSCLDCILTSLCIRVELPSPKGKNGPVDTQSALAHQEDNRILAYILPVQVSLGMPRTSCHCSGAVSGDSRAKVGNKLAGSVCYLRGLELVMKI